MEHMEEKMRDKMFIGLLIGIIIGIFLIAYPIMKSGGGLVHKVEQVLELENQFRFHRHTGMFGKIK